MTKPKRCCNCLEWFPPVAEYFYMHPTRADSYCRDCRRELARLNHRGVYPRRRPATEWHGQWKSHRVNTMFSVLMDREKE